MRRHPALVPLSHHHHHALVIARRTRRAADAPTGEQLVAAREFLAFFNEDAIEHFRAEEEDAFPLLLMGDAEPPVELGQALLEHARLRALARELRAGLADGALTPDILRGIGELLESHVRLEERTLFPMIEQRAASILADGLPRTRRLGGDRGPVVDLALPARGRGPQWGMQSIDLNATLLVWPAGAGVAEHSNTERDVFVVVLEGSAELTLDGVTHEIGTHELILLPRDSTRAITAGRDGVRYLDPPTSRTAAPALGLTSITSEPEGCHYSDSRSGSRTFTVVDQATEAVAPLDRADGEPRRRVGWFEPKSAMGALVVVVGDVLVDDMREVLLVSDQDPIETSRRIVRTNRSAYAFATGVRTRVKIVRIPSRAKTVSKARVNFESRSRMSTRTARSRR